MVTWSGVSRQNIAIYNGLALGNMDAVLLEGETMDMCYSHASPNNFAQHVHSISPCINGAGVTGSTTVKPGACNDSGADCLDDGYVNFRAGWVNTDTYGGVYGLGTDGHVVYGPFNAAGETWSCDDVDMCNGFFLADGAYAYASTTFFPYIVGCWGPAYASHDFLPTCTTNGCSASSSTDAAATIAYSVVALSLLVANTML